MQKRWVSAQEVEPAKVERLGGALGINSILATLLVRRGIEDFNSARKFFRPELEDLHDPFLMKDMHRAIERIDRALGHNEKIVIYGDYDVDGTTAVALVYDFFRQFHSRLEYYLPDRYKEGYGLSFQGIDYAREQGVTLIITLDCGIKDHEKISYAQSMGIDVIVADHHLPGIELPPAYAVLDPKRPDCPYPYKELSGCGIGFKIIQAFVAQNKMDDMEIGHAFQYLDLVAVSIAADIVPITGENRILAHYGLIQLNTNPRCGLQALIELSAQPEAGFTMNDILFQLGPRINAAGRIHHARDAVRLLLANTLQDAYHYVSGIDEQNTRRKDVDFRITQEALDLIECNTEHPTRVSTVLFKDDWHKGVIGIVASRLVDRYYRPTVILTKSNGRVTGSARSIEGFDLYEALTECSDLLDQFGGHKYAAGLTMNPDKVHSFQERFEQVAARTLTLDMLVPEVRIDSELDLGQVDARFFRILSQFEPFGPEQECPVFCSRSVQVYGSAHIVGENHLKMQIHHNNSSLFDCIGFGLGHFVERINTGEPFDICYVMQENVWRSKRNLQLHIKDVRF